MSEENIRSNKIIAHDILKELKKSGYEDYTAKAWDFYKPETSLWWIIPRKGNPSEKYGKICIRRYSDNYRVGLHIEKGITGIAAKELSIPNINREKVVISDDWKWNILLRDIENGELEKNLIKIVKEIGEPLKIIIHSYEYNRPDDLRNYDDMITFKFYNGKLKFVQNESVGDIKNYKNIEKISGLKEILENPNNDWCWINMYIVFEIDEKEITYPYKYVFTFIENYNEIFRE